MAPSFSTEGRAPTRESAATNRWGVGVDDAHGISLVTRHEIVDARIGDQRAAADDHEPLRGERHLVDQVARDQHRPAFRGKVTQQVPDPADALRVEAVDRLVQEQHAGVSQEGAGDAEPLSHAQRELPRSAVGHRREPDEVEHGVHASGGNVVGLGEPAQMVPCAPSGMEGLGVEQRPDLAQGPGQFVVTASIDERRTRIWLVQAEDHAHGGGLPRAVRAEESGDDAGRDGEAQVVDGDASRP